MKRGWKAYVWKLLWLVGFIILLNFHFNLGEEIRETASTNFVMTPYLWFNAVMSFVIGLYIALFFVKRWRWNFNLPLYLCVATPCLLIHFSIPILFSASIEGLKLPLWFVSASTSNIVGIVAGISLLLSMFSDSSEII